ncbi:hypothetical protein BRADI_5g02570v3 [Brachypodium distachyon]|uniref:Uncharacterized protein n=1 Tax=Brachypodium distachyon TaxID=15368 RepID=A0A0Q3E249_BRADI|nr:hypothetical protein BRADI_5g02570v3 [Brachypodium distachyon]
MRAPGLPERIVRGQIDKSDISFEALVGFKQQLGYSARDYLYYKKRHGRDIATVVAIDFPTDAVRMMTELAEEKEIRAILRADEQHDKHVQITPIKRPREGTPDVDDDAPGSDEPIDAYKDWLLERETQVAYKTCVPTEEPTQVDDNSQESNESKDSSTTPLQQWPSHARHNKDKAKGTLKGLAASRKRLKSRTQKLSIEFSPNLGGLCGDNARTFVDEVVTYTRLSAPLIGVKRWKDIHQVVKNKIVNDVMVCS